MNAILPSEPILVNAEADSPTAIIDPELLACMATGELDLLRLRMLASFILAHSLAARVRITDCDCTDADCPMCAINRTADGFVMVLETVKSMAEGGTPHSSVVAARAMAAAWADGPLPVEVQTPAKMMPDRELRDRADGVRDALTTIRRLAHAAQDNESSSAGICGAIDELVEIADRDILRLLARAGDEDARRELDGDENEDAAA